MLARQQEVFAGFLTHTDAQIGRVLSSLERLGVMDNTLVMVFSDNGASAEGGKDGSVNEHRFTAHLRESVADNLAHYDDWGGFSTYNHYSWGWAWAGNTPHKLWKRYTWLGGTRTPLIVHWGGRVAQPGRGAHAVRPRHRPHAARSWRPSGSRSPTRSTAWPSSSVDGVSLLAALEDPGAAEQHHTQYFEMLGSRSIYHEGWKATTNHISTGVLDEEELAVGSRSFDEDRWELFDLSTDFSEATDRAGDEPERLRRLTRPVGGRGGAQQRAAHLRRPGRPLRRVHPAGLAGRARRGPSCPGGGPVADESVPLLWGGFRLTADVDDAPRTADGVICALGDWFGGYALYVSTGASHFTFARSARRARARSADVRWRRARTSSRCFYAVGADGAPGRMALLVDGAEVDATSVEGILADGAPARRRRPAARARQRVPRLAALHATRPLQRHGAPAAIEAPGARRPDPADEVRAALHAD